MDKDYFVEEGETNKFTNDKILEHNINTCDQNLNSNEMNNYINANIDEYIEEEEYTDQMLNKKRNLISYESLNVKNINQKYKNENNSNLNGNLIYDIDEDNLGTSRPYDSDFYEEYTENIEIEPDENIIRQDEYEKKLEEIKTIRKEKLTKQCSSEFIEPNERKPNQVLINDIYDIIDNDNKFNNYMSKRDNDSDTDLNEWELSKLKNGMNTSKTPFKTTLEIPKGKDSGLSSINMDVDLDEIINKVNEDITNEELYEESVNNKKQNYKLETEKIDKEKELNIHKVDFYINQYLKLKTLYLNIVKEHKRMGGIDKDKIKDIIGDDVYFIE